MHQKNEFEIIHNDSQKTPANSVADEVKSSFYQFALDHNSVINNLKDNYGYKLTHKSSRNGLKGFNEAHPSFPIVLKLYNYRGASKLMKGVRYVLSDILARLGYGHTIEMILVKPS